MTYTASASHHERALAVLAGGVSSNFRMGGQPVPLAFTRGAGAHLWDADGNDYVDYVLGMGPVILGHAPAAPIRAVAESLEAGQLYAGQHEGEVELARRVQRLLPSAELVRFGLSGSEMVQAALRVARAATGRRLVVKFEGHYHGWFDTILASTAPPLDRAGPRHAPVAHLPSAGQSQKAADDLAILPWNDLATLERFLESHAHEAAAVIMEPILCNTSVIVPRPGYLEGVRALCDRYEVVLIFDEVITGFRVGPGGAQARLGVTPDLSVLAKALGAGFPIAALAGRRRYMDLIGEGRVLHGGTFNSNVISVVAAIAALDELTGDNGRRYAAMERLGEELMAGIEALAASCDLPLRVQGLGMVFNTHFGDGDLPTDYRTYAGADLARQRALLLELQNAGVKVTSRGTWFLSTAHTRDDVERTLEAAAAAFAAVAQH